jgi:hypothetical protein
VGLVAHAPKPLCVDCEQDRAREAARMSYKQNPACMTTHAHCAAACPHPNSADSYHGSVFSQKGFLTASS